MNFPRSLILTPLLAVLAVSSLSLTANAQGPGGGPGGGGQGRGPGANAAAATPAPGAPPAPMANPLPADAHVAQSIEQDGKTIKYTATVGTLPVKNAEDKAVAEVVFTSYIVDEPNRPITFAFNGGPGAASVYLNLGAIGPKRVDFGAEGQSPSDPAILKDNPGTWLGFTDLVFIDPVGTGFSRSLVSPAESRTLFYGPDQDIAYLSKIVYDWLVKNNRLLSRKYIVGESYGGYRGPRLTSYLQSQIGVGINGLVLVSPALNSTEGDRNLSPVPWMLTLPSIVAANYERKGTLSDKTMAPVIEYTRGEYAEDLLRGNSDPAATPRLVKRVTELTGLDPTFVRESGGRLRNPGLPPRRVPRDRQTRQPLRSQRYRLRSLSLRPHAGIERPHPAQHHRADHHGHGGLGDTHGRLEDRRTLQRPLERSLPRLG